MLATWSGKYFILHISAWTDIFRLLPSKIYTLHASVLVRQYSINGFRIEKMTKSNNFNDVVSNEKKSSSSKTYARMIPTDLLSLQKSGARLQSGHLVSFPTETVYGLGCHARDSSAIRRVFQAKERPLTDPLIVHISQVDDAWPLWEIDNYENLVIAALTQTFWPGPLTVIARASSIVPSILTANTGFVACRCPSHPIARELIRCAGVPVAAPSANKFGHVSPTNARQVWNDLSQEDVWILDPHLPGNISEDRIAIEKEVNVKTSICCRVGVESTVVKVETRITSLNDDSPIQVNGTVQILRKGSVSTVEVYQCLLNAGLIKCSNSTHDQLNKQYEHTFSAIFTVEDDIKYTSRNVHNVAPGQIIKHYSPHVKRCVIVSRCLHYSIENNHAWNREEKEVLSKSVVIDFGGRLRMMALYALAYRDISPSNDSSEAASVLFDVLRWAELVTDVQTIYLPEIHTESKNCFNKDALLDAIKDRLIRAASGIIVDNFSG